MKKLFSKKLFLLGLLYVILNSTYVQRIKTKLFLWFLLLSIACNGYSQSLEPNCHTIDFEKIPTEILEEGLIIGDQFYDSLGVKFSLESETDTLPRIAEVGSPTTAFISSYGADMPAPDQNIGEYFLTDDGVLSGLQSPPLMISFKYPVDSACGVILDVDYNEDFTVLLLDSAKQTLDSIFVKSGDENTGDGIATNWAFKRESADVFYLKLVGKRTASGSFGLGFDNFSFCTSSLATAISDKISEGRFHDYLRGNFPNPFTRNTIIEYSISQRRNIEIDVYDHIGRKLKTLQTGIQQAGNHEVNFDASGLPGGVYFYQLKTGSTVQTKKMIVK